MRRNAKKFLAVTLAASMVMSGLSTNLLVAEATGTQGATIQLTDADVAELSGMTSVTRTSVHDPSIVKDGDSYYVFGSHMGVSKTTDLQNWTSVTGEDTSSTLFGNETDGVVSVVPYTEAYLNNAYTGTVKTVINGVETEVDFGTDYNIAEWITPHNIQGNQWAPDVIYNDTMDKWCMYMSLNGPTWNSAIVLLTADSIEGPYVYQGPVVFSGFNTADSTKSFKNTDLGIVLGEQDELPEKYQQIEGNHWGTYWPHAIDPCVFYDEEGKLWLTYGSWSGGIYNLELDENTGLRDYTVTYESNFDEKGASVTSDEYFGTKIAGGYYVSGEGAYIEHIEDYYYLFVSYGFYSPEGGYNMRVFRSENPDGPFVDGNGNSAIFTKYIQNFSALDTANNRGEKIMANYQWATMAKGETAQGHNSAFVDSDGKAYVVYHTKFNDGSVAHEVRVHQMYVNSEGWLTVSPYEYSGETISATGYTADEIVGTYEMITHEYQVDYSDLECMTPVVINLNVDGTVTGAKTGTWSTVEGTSDAVLVLDGTTYYGKFTEEVIDGTTVKTMGFTFASNAGLCVWGTKQLGDSIAVAQTVANDMLTAPIAAYQSFELETEGQSGAVITWESSNPSVLAADGTVTKPAVDTVVTLTGTVSKGDYYYTKDFPVTVYAQDNAEESVVIAKYFADEAKDLGTGLDASIQYVNPFNSDVTAVDISGGVKIAFDAKSVRDMAFLGTIFSFMGDNGNNGRLYMTPGSYLGYNATGGYFDANMTTDGSYALVTDYIGESAHVEVELTGTGFTVTVNDEVAYTQDIIGTDGGAGNVTNYKYVLDWLQNTANELYFGYGSWWNAVGFDESNIEISNVVLSVNAVSEKAPVVTTGSYEKDEVVLTTSSDLTVENNPFYGVQAEQYTFNYTIEFAEDAAKNGWDGIFSFYNSATGGRVSFQTAPYVCYNDANGKWMDINNPNLSGDNFAATAEKGKEYQVSIVINATGVKITVDGEEIALGINGSGADYEELLAFIGECDQLTWGVGQATTSYWWTELCTVSDITMVAGPADWVADEDETETETDDVPVITDATYTKDEVVLATNADITVEENPFYGLQTDRVQFDYTINFAEGAAKGGWDGIFSFYNSTTGGRVSFQTAPYVCFNSMVDGWLDINNPDAGGTNFAATAEYGKDYQVSIVITADGATATVDGEEIALAITNDAKDYEDLIAFIGTCDQLTWGVGQGTTAFWWTEMCTLTDIEFIAGEGEQEPEIPDEPVVTADTYTASEVVLASNDAITVIDNPFKGLDIDKARFDYTINFADTAAKNGWDSIFSFYDSASTGRLSVQTAPFISFQPWTEDWMDINSPGTDGSTDWAATAEKGKDYQVSIIMTDTEVKMYVDGAELTTTTGGGTTANNVALIDFLTTADQLTFGVGLAQTSFWNTEVCTLKNVKLTVGDAVDLTAPEAPSVDDEPEVETPVITSATYTKDSVTLASDTLITETNPLKGFEGDKLRFDYTINFADTAAKGGWDSIFSFYNTANTGRVSVQTNPYVCFQPWAETWMDINAPAAGGTDWAATAECGKDYNISIIITDSSAKMYVDGVELTTITGGGTEASLAALIDFVGTCDQLTIGVGQGTTSFWWTEICTLTNLKITAGDAVDLTAPVAPEQPDDEESSEVESSTDEESSEVESSTDEESSEVESSTDEESSDVESSTDEESSDVESSTDEESSEVESSTDEESSEVESSTDEESSEVESSTDEESSDVESSTDEESSDVESSTDEESSDVESSTDEESSDVESSTDEESSEVESSEEESSKEEESKTPESKPSSSQSSAKPAPVVPKKVVEIVEIIEEIIPLASSVEEAGYSFVDLVLSNKNANLTSKLLGKYFGVDMMLQAHLGNGVGFTIDANTLSESNVEMNISSELRTLNTFADGFSTFHVKPSKAAKLGQEVGLHVNLGKEFEGKKAYIYTKNILTGKLEFKAAMTVNEIGNVGLFTSEMTDVVIMVEN